MPPLVTNLDHIILGIRDLGAGTTEFAERTGVNPVGGGAHPGRGTANALVGLDQGHYLEIIAPTATEIDPMFVGIASLDRLTPFGWALRTDDLAATVKRLRARDFDVNDPRAGSRRREDGTLLEWHTAELAESELAFAPFFIQWNASTLHPSSTSPTGCRLAGLRFIEPRAARMVVLLETIGYRVRVERAPTAAMMVTLECPRGPVTFTT